MRFQVGTDCEAAGLEIARAHNAEAARRAKQKRVKRIKCLDCGELLADSDAFQAHCMDESVEVHPTPPLGNAPATPR